jgi:parallel beta-helix repeat protein
MISKKCQYSIIFIIIYSIFVTLSNESFLIESAIPSSNFSDPAIIINSDSDFIAMGFPGNGSSSSPYIISDYNIDASESLTSGIFVSGTTKYFIIENCMVSSTYVGILLDDVTEGTGIIRNNTCISKNYNGGGIGVSGTNILIVNNTCKDFAQGIHANVASNLSILNNTILNSSYQGINIRYTSESVIAGNIIKNCKEYAIAIVRSSSSGNVVYNNFLENNTYVNEVNIDGVNKGKPSSQGYDEGNGNKWCNESTQTGNCWSDYKGRGIYSIDGTAGSIDQHPNNCFNNRNIPGFIGIGLVGLVFSGVFAFYIAGRKSK